MHYYQGSQEHLQDLYRIFTCEHPVPAHIKYAMCEGLRGLSGYLTVAMHKSYIPL